MKIDKFFIYILFFLFGFDFIFTMNRDIGLGSDEFQGKPFTLIENDTFFTFTDGKKSYTFRKKNKNSDKYFLEKDTEDFSSHDKLLLRYLVDSEFKKFLENFKSFIKTGFSNLDFNKRQQGRSFFFFFLGLLSPLQSVPNFKVSIGTHLDKSTKSFDSNFWINYKHMPFLKITIKGIEAIELYADNSKSFFEKPSPIYPEIRILYSKKRINSAFHNIYVESNGFNYRKKNRKLSGKLSFFNYSDNLFINNIIKKNYIKKLWHFYGVLKWTNSKKDSRLESDFSSEKDFHMFILGLLANTRGILELLSNTERGHGRPDIIFKMKPSNKLLKYIFEFKVSQDENRASALTENAIKQIDSKGYILTPSRGRRVAKINYLFGLSMCLGNGKIFLNKRVENIEGPSPLMIRGERKSFKSDDYLF